jgi:hypothetical protein
MVASVKQRHKFRVIDETADNQEVLRMPWLKKMNPQSDWNTRTEKIGSTSLRI